MIEIYLKTNTNYDKNGDITLDPTSCAYKDSESLVTLEHFIDDEGRWKYINFENVIAAGGDRRERDCHHPLHIPLFWTLGRTLAGRQHSCLGPAGEIHHWCVGVPRGVSASADRGGSKILGEGGEGCRECPVLTLLHLSLQA